MTDASSCKFASAATLVLLVDVPALHNSVMDSAGSGGAGDTLRQLAGGSHQMGTNR